MIIAMMVGIQPGNMRSVPAFFTALTASSRPEPNTAGMAMRKLRRTADSRVYPSARPTVMVPPERDTPGMSAIDWPRPNRKASR